MLKKKGTRSEQNPLSCDVDSLVDLRDISIDTEKPVADRVCDFIEQVKNPYLFKVGDITIKVNYRNGRTITDAVIALLKD